MARLPGYDSGPMSTIPPLANVVAVQNEMQVRAELQPRKEHTMDNILDILQALALAASTARTIFELWREITHMSDE